MTAMNLESARPQLLAIAEALDDAAHAAYKKADEMLSRYLESTDGELFGHPASGCMGLRRQTGWPFLLYL